MIEKKFEKFEKEVKEMMKNKLVDTQFVEEEFIIDVKCINAHFIIHPMCIIYDLPLAHRQPIADFQMQIAKSKFEMAKLKITN